MFYIPVLTIAGSDSCGGAGIQADIKTFSALGTYAMSVITAVTAQNTLGVRAIQIQPSDVITSQIRAVMEDIPPKAIKIGMVGNSSAVVAIADALRSYDVENLVVDPVMVATSSDRLMEEDSLVTFIQSLIPLATLLTPNIPEAEVLAKMTILNVEDMRVAALKILDYGCFAVLVKGGHLAGEYKPDLLVWRDAAGVASERLFTYPTISTPNTHGTGCTLSSAIAAFLARGLKLEDAVAEGREYLQRALVAGSDVLLGRGHGAVNHLFDPEVIIKNA